MEIAGVGKKTKRTAVANGGKYDILKGIPACDIPVTEEAIQRVPKVCPTGWNDDQAVNLQTAHRKLLRLVKDKPLATEAGAMYSEDMRLIIRQAGGVGSIKMPVNSEPYILLHTHPDGLTFLAADIQTFIKRFDLSLLTAVGNDGSVYVIQKTEGYAAADFVKAFATVVPQLEKVNNADEYAELMNKFLEGVGTYGVKFICGR